MGDADQAAANGPSCVGIEKDTKEPWYFVLICC